MPDDADLLSFDAFMRHWAHERPDVIALKEGDRALTYAGLEQRTAQVVAALLAQGLKKGDRIAWLGKNSDLYFILLYGAARLGVVMVPIGWRLAPPEIAYIANDTRARLLFAGPGFDDIACGVAGDLAHVEHIFTSTETRRWIDAAQRVEFTPAGPDDAVLQLYTSGTTGHPKGAVLSNRNLFGLRRAASDAKLPWADWDVHELGLICMPCAHIGGTGLGVMCLVAGVPGLVLPEFTPDGVLDAVEAGVTRFFLVPAAIQMVVNHPRAATTDFSHLKYVIYGAAPIPLGLLKQCMAIFRGASFLQAYGMTETCGTIAMLPPEDHDPDGNARMRSTGKALPGVEIKVVDADGAFATAGVVGEIVTRSVGNMMGYWNMPEATTKTLDADGWVRTGDAGYLDADGYLFIHDRVKDLIISGGENIYPAEVENAIFGHPDVAEVAVIGVPDAQWGEAVKAVCVPKPGATIDEHDIIAWARKSIAGFKLPKSVDSIDLLPRNAAGKILRRELRAPYWEGHARLVN
jgi:acyl-CoA synthetase (AMP-forming)/AMP-acid ligase II